MLARVVRPLVALVVALVAGCAITHPPDYQQLAHEPPVVIEATRGVMYGVAPRSWDLPDGRKVVIDTQRASLVSGMGFYRVAAGFELRIEGGGPSLRCATDPDASDLPQTRFGCWDGSGHTAFWFAKGEACEARDVGMLETLTTPACWRGVLDVGGTRYEVAYAHLSKSKVVIDRVTWTDMDGRVVQAADIVSEMRIELFRPDQTPVGDALVLHALALHRYSQILSM